MVFMVRECDKYIAVINEKIQFQAISSKVINFKISNKVSTLAGVFTKQV